MLAFSEEVANLDEGSVKFAGVGHEGVAGVVLDHSGAGYDEEGRIWREKEQKYCVIHLVYTEMYAIHTCSILLSTQI